MFENQTQNGQHLPQDCHIFKEENQVCDIYGWFTSYKFIYAINVSKLEYM